MAGIRQLSSGNWNVQIRERGKRGRSQTFHSEKKVRKWAALNDGTYKFRPKHFTKQGCITAILSCSKKASNNLKTL